MLRAHQGRQTFAGACFKKFSFCHGSNGHEEKPKPTSARFMMNLFYIANL